MLLVDRRRFLAAVAAGVITAPVVAAAQPAGRARQRQAAETAARALELRMQALETRTPADIDLAFATMTRQKVDGLLVLADVMLNEQRLHIADLALGHRLPAVFNQEGPAGLVTYSADTQDLFRRAATYIDRILKGARPGAPRGPGDRVDA